MKGAIEVLYTSVIFHLVTCESVCARAHWLFFFPLINLTLLLNRIKTNEFASSKMIKDNLQPIKTQLQHLPEK